MEIRRRTDKEGLARKFFQADPFIPPEIARFAADQNVGTYSPHRPERGAYGGLLLRGPGRHKAGPLRPINQVEGRDRLVRDQVAFEGQPELGLEIPDGSAADIIDAAELALDGKCQSEGRAVPVQELVAQIN